MTDLITIVIAMTSMAAIGFIAWKMLSAQERGDTEFHAKLDEDDERARKGREGRK